MCIICGPFISKNIAVEVSLWICCKILSKEKKINRKYPPFFKRKTIFHPKVQFILLWHLLTLIKNLSMFVQGLCSNLPGRSFKSLSYRGIYRIGGALMGCGEKSQRWNSSLQVKVTAVLLFLAGGVWQFGLLFFFFFLLELWGGVHDFCTAASAPEAALPQYDQYTFGMADSEEWTAQPSLWSPDPSELACTTLTLRCCLRLEGFEGPAELIIEVLVQVLRQWVQQGAWEQSNPLGLTHFNILPWFGKDKWPWRFWQHLSLGIVSFVGDLSMSQWHFGRWVGTSRKLCQLLFLSLKDQLGSSTVISWQSGGFSSPSNCKDVVVLTWKWDKTWDEWVWSIRELPVPLYLPPCTAQLLTRAGLCQGAKPLYRQAMLFLWVLGHLCKTREAKSERTKDPVLIVSLMLSCVCVQREWKMSEKCKGSCTFTPSKFKGWQMKQVSCFVEVSLLKVLPFFFPNKVTNNFRLNKYLEINILLNFLRFPWLETKSTSSLLKRIHLTFDKAFFHSLLLLLNRRSEEKHQRSKWLPAMIFKPKYMTWGTLDIVYMEVSCPQIICN